MALLSSIGTAHARDYFNPALLEIDNPALRGADLSVFEENSSQAPGNYRADLYLNGEQIDSLDVEFRLMPGADGASAAALFQHGKIGGTGREGGHVSGDGARG